MHLGEYLVHALTGKLGVITPDLDRNTRTHNVALIGMPVSKGT
jgi:hypothetical protein